jgi:hypothetical protein
MAGLYFPQEKQAPAGFRGRPEQTNPEVPGRNGNERQLPMMNFFRNVSIRPKKYNQRLCISVSCTSSG